MNYDTEKPLTEAEIQALYEALADEYKVVAFCAEVIKKQGNICPFTNIILSEHQHSTSLIKLLEAIALEIPENTYIDNLEVPAILQEACQIGVDAEILNAQLYERLLDQVDNVDVLRVFENLFFLSENNHLLAFELCN